MNVRIALAGNPNCGKTTLFNALTGSNQFVGNWPGVTVEKKEGKLKSAKSGVGGGVMAVLPGVMGVSAFAPPLDEAGNSVKAQLAVKFIMNKLGLGVFNGDNVTITE